MRFVRSHCNPVQRHFERPNPDGRAVVLKHLQFVQQPPDNVQQQAAPRPERVFAVPIAALDRYTPGDRSGRALDPEPQTALLVDPTYQGGQDLLGEPVPAGDPARGRIRRGQPLPRWDRLPGLDCVGVMAVPWALAPQLGVRLSGQYRPNLGARDVSFAARMRT